MTAKFNFFAALDFLPWPPPSMPIVLGSRLISVFDDTLGELLRSGE